MSVCRYILLGVLALLCASCGNGEKKSHQHSPSSSQSGAAQSGHDSSEHSPAAAPQPVTPPVGHSTSDSAHQGSSSASSADQHTTTTPSVSGGKSQELILQHLQAQMGFYSETLSADFTQEKLIGNNRTVQRGHLELKRPDHFLWETYVDGGTDLDQQILGNGRVYWQNEPSLDQVLKRKVDLSRLPLIRLLLHSNQSLDHILQDFILSESGSGSESVFVLQPKPNSNVALNQISIRFRDKKLDQLILTNSVTDRSVFTFVNQKINTPIDNSHFCYSGKIEPVDPAGNPAPLKSGDCV